MVKIFALVQSPCCLTYCPDLLKLERKRPQKEQLKQKINFLVQIKKEKATKRATTKAENLF